MLPGLAVLRGYRRDWLAGDLLARLQAFGLAGEIGPELLFPTLPTAVQAYRDRTKNPGTSNQRP
jgi:hypothetical protein